ncbi:MAG: RNA polymerase factor sigma-54 [Muribaculaceae bacterium]|nr:RNA polymerase factor sigma-54 [Muribaculaceae bacterium]
MAQELTLGTRLGMHMTQQQLRFVELLELTAPELDDEVEREIEANPALEVVEDSGRVEASEADRTPYYLRRASGGGGDEAPREFAPVDTGESLYDVLLEQISQSAADEDTMAMARYLAGNLDSNGYLRRPLGMVIEDIAADRGIEVKREVAEGALQLLRSLEPAGVGAENLRECLLLQLYRMPPSKVRDDSIRILEEQFEAFSMRHSHRIISALHMSRDEIAAANALILTLNPKPGASYGGAASTAAGVIVPDYNVGREDDGLYISLNNHIPELAIGESFAEAVRGLEGRRGRPRKGTEFVRDRYKSASEFLQLLRQRQQTMMGIMTAIVAHQKEYFETGDVYALRPMILKDIERATGYDKSVISRATNNKYVATPWGAVMPVRAFFSDTVTSARRAGADEVAPAEGGSDGDEAEGQQGDVLTNRQIEAAIRELVEHEDKRHPLSDEKLRGELLKRGYDVSRRTVAKYRDRTGILVARLRRQL